MPLLFIVLYVVCRCRNQWMRHWGTVLRVHTHKGQKWYRAVIYPYSLPKLLMLTWVTLTRVLKWHYGNEKMASMAPGFCRISTDSCSNISVHYAQLYSWSSQQVPARLLCGMVSDTVVPDNSRCYRCCCLSLLLLLLLLQPTHESRRALSVILPRHQRTNSRTSRRRRLTAATRRIAEAVCVLYVPLLLSYHTTGELDTVRSACLFRSSSFF